MSDSVRTLTGSKPILSLPCNDSLQLDELSTSRVVTGLVRVRASDVHGLSQDEAARSLASLYGLDRLARLSLGEEEPPHDELQQVVASRIIDRSCGTADHLELFMQLAD